MARSGLAISRWFPTYDSSWFKADFVSGLTVSAVLIPSALSYAAIIGVEPIYGLYTIPLALVAYAIFGGSRLLVVGPDAALSVLAGNTVVAVAAGPDQVVAVVVALSFLVGVMFVVASIARMGWIADTVPDPVLKGFIQGLCWVTILGQLPALFGTSPDGDYPDFWRKSVAIFRSLSEMNTATALLGVGCVVALFGLRWLAPRVPGTLLVLAASMVIVAILGLADDGVGVVGAPSGGFITLHLPTGLSLDQWMGLLPGALAIVVVGFTESMGAAKTAAEVTREQLDPDEELRALGMSNFGSGLFGGYVVTGALSKTSVAIASNGKSQVGNFVSAVVAVLALLILRPLFTDMANTVLAALVIFAMATMVNFAYFRRLWRVSRLECVIAIATMLAVMTFGVLPGVVAGVALSMVILLDRIGRPVGYLKEVDDDGLLIYHQLSTMVFLNARRSAQRIKETVRETGMKDGTVIIDMSDVTAIDSTGLSALLELVDNLGDDGISVWFVAADEPYVGIVHRAEQDAEKWFAHSFASCDEAVAFFESDTGSR